VLPVTSESHAVGSVGQRRAIVFGCSGYSCVSAGGREELLCNNRSGVCLIRSWTYTDDESNLGIPNNSGTWQSNWGFILRKSVIHLLSGIRMRSL
jgi:hypothetical protein